MRRIVLVLIVAALFPLPTASFAKERCRDISIGNFPGRYCEAELDSNFADQVSQDQINRQWCWAASISMALSAYGHRITQEEVVRQAWGGMINMPVVPIQIVTGLNRTWTDSKGKKFQTKASLIAKPINGAYRELANGHPLIVGSLGHAMVVTAMGVFITSTGNVIIDYVTVRDPWPLNQRKRFMTRQEVLSANMFALITTADTEKNAEHIKNGGPGLDKCESKCKARYDRCVSSYKRDVSDCVKEKQSACMNDCMTHRDYFFCKNIACDSNNPLNSGKWNNDCGNEIVEDSPAECEERYTDCRKDCSSR